MKKMLGKILLLLMVMGSCAGYLGTFARKTVAADNDKGVSLSIWLVKALNLKELAVGFLWMRFDNDTVYQLANHHRLLITLDAITAVKEDDFDAWSLKNYMRLDRSIKQKDEEMKARALRDYELACRLNSEDWHYYHDAAQMIYNRLKDKNLALTYAQKGFALAKDQVKPARLLGMICYDLKKFAEAAVVYEKILKNPDAEASEKKVAEKMLKLIELAEK